MGYRILIMLGILVANGFFAAAEVSLVSVRRSRLKALADQGQAGAVAALSLLDNPERLLSVTQVGVTLASLGLGWAGEETLFNLITDADRTHHYAGDAEHPARRLFRARLPADELRARRNRRGGAEERRHGEG